MIYRSTLDPALRMEEKRVITEVGALILATLGLYLTITPGVLGGFVDYYVLRPLLGQKRYTIDDFVVKDKLGEGGFGVVYRATGKNDGETYVLKQCKDYGEAEIWTNSRLQRACPDAIASYCGAFYGPKNFKGRNVIKDGSIWKRALNSRAGQEEEEDPLWIVWKFEGSDTLFKLMNDKDFPYNVEPYLFKSGVAIDGEPKGTKRKAKIISTIFGQILENLSAAHGTGIILRDVKPENIIFDPVKGKFKLIDLGAAADLRFGFNYQPKEFILDPRFSGPEEYIMSTQTPEPPPTPVALALSPALWQLNLPDRFDSYSAGGDAAADVPAHVAQRQQPHRVQEEARGERREPEPVAQRATPAVVRRGGRRRVRGARPRRPRRLGVVQVAHVPDAREALERDGRAVQPVHPGQEPGGGYPRLAHSNPGGVGPGGGGGRFTGVAGVSRGEVGDEQGGRLHRGAALEFPRGGDHREGGGRVEVPRHGRDGDLGQVRGEQDG